MRISRYGAAEVFIDFAEEFKHTEANTLCKIHESRCTSRVHSRPKSFARNDLPSATPMLQKYEDRSQEETEWQERGAREAAWNLAKSVLKLKEKNKATFFSPSEK